MLPSALLFNGEAVYLGRGGTVPSEGWERQLLQHGRSGGESVRGRPGEQDRLLGIPGDL